MKKILLQLCSDKLANVFDTITAYDTDVDCVLQYSGVAPDDASDLVSGIFLNPISNFLRVLCVSVVR